MHTPHFLQVTSSPPELSKTTLHSNQEVAFFPVAQIKNTQKLRQKISRLSFFHKIMHNLSPVALPSHFESTNRFTCNHHPLHIIIPWPHSSTSAYQYSSSQEMYIRYWNTLLTCLVEINNDDLFHSNFLIT